MSTEYDKTMATEQGCDRGTGTSVTFAEQARDPGNTVRECDSGPVPLSRPAKRKGLLARLFGRGKTESAEGRATDVVATYPAAKGVASGSAHAISACDGGTAACDGGTAASVMRSEAKCDSEPVPAVTCATTGRSNRVVAA